MSPPWSKPIDVDRLADGRADIDFAIPLAELPRLRARVANVQGSVSGHVQFAREAGTALAELTMTGAAQVRCQRCLEMLEITIDGTTRVGLVATEADVGSVPEDLEPMLAPEGRTSIAEIVEEELLLALPIVPLHEEECAVAASAPLVTDAPEEQTTQRPFEQLAELLKRK
jgi:uncharacterized protein